jgi:anti-anti-sigma factor
VGQLAGATFEIHESTTDHSLRLSLTGELDHATAPQLGDRLASLRAARYPVSLDLSQLEFIDSAGIHLLFQTMGESRLKGWDVTIEPDLSPQVLRLFKLVRLDRYVTSA